MKLFFTPFVFQKCNLYNKQNKKENYTTLCNQNSKQIYDISNFLYHPSFCARKKEYSNHKAFYVIGNNGEIKKFDTLTETAKEIKVSKDIVAKATSENAKYIGGQAIIRASGLELTDESGKVIFDENDKPKLNMSKIHQIFADFATNENYGVYAVDYDGNIQRFQDRRDVAKALDIKSAQVTKCLNKELKLAKGYLLLKSMEIEKKDENGRIAFNEGGLAEIDYELVKDAMQFFKDAYNQPLYAIDYEGNLIRFQNIKEASEKLGVGASSISSQMVDKNVLPTEYVFVKAFDVEKRDEKSHTIKNKNGEYELNVQEVLNLVKKFNNSAILPMYAIDINNYDEIRRFDDIQELSRELNIPISNIYQQMREPHRKGRKYIFVKAFDIEKRNEFGKLLFDKSGRPIIDKKKLDLIIEHREKKYNTQICAIKNGKIHKFQNIKEASLKLGISREEIKKCLTGEYNNYNGYSFILNSKLLLRDEQGKPVFDENGKVLIDTKVLDKSTGY